jgi:hypothetical protein
MAEAHFLPLGAVARAAKSTKKLPCGSVCCERTINFSQLKNILILNYITILNHTNNKQKIETKRP